MIRGDTWVEILNLSAHTVSSMTVDGLWCRYQMNMRMQPSKRKVALIDATIMDRLYIQDMYGWTRLLGIASRPLAGKNVYMWNIRFTNRHVWVAEDAFIPVFKADDPVYKWNGDVQWDAQLIAPDQLQAMEKKGFRMRIRNSEEDEFPLTIDMERQLYTEPVIYQLFTDSGFYNANGIRLCDRKQTPLPKGRRKKND